MNPTGKAGSRLFITSVCLILAAILFFNHAGTAVASVPTVLQAVNLSQGPDGRIKLEITHSNPSPNHFVDMVEVQVVWLVQDCYLSPAGATERFSLQPQITDPFEVELDLGTLQATPEVKARAHCNIHGWSDWSDWAQTIAVPEFPTMALVTLTMLVAIFVFKAGTPGRTRGFCESERC